MWGRLEGSARTPKGSRNPFKRAAFTLFEALVAIAVGGILLAAMSSYLVILTNIWLNRSNGDFSVQHVEGVTLFLSTSFAQSESPVQESAEPVRWERPPGFNEFEDPLLTFQLTDSPPLLVWDDVIFPGITAHLYLGEDEGMSLLWYSRFSEVEGIDDLRRTQISPFVERISYCYFDADSDSWEILEEPKEDRDRQLILPDFVKILFEHNTETREVSLYLPRRGQNVPIH